MGIRRPSQAKRRDPQKDRGSADLSGRVLLAQPQSLADLAAQVYRDRRVTPLLVDLNPELGPGVLAAGTTVTLPSKEEAQRFAARMGFSLGFEPERGGATRAQRAWRSIRDGAGQAQRASAQELAGLLVGQGLPPAVVARRLAALVPAAELERFFADAGADPGLADVVGAGRRQAAEVRVRSRLRLLAGAFDTAAHAGNRRALLAAAGSRADEVGALLSALLVPEAVAKAVLDVGAAWSARLDRVEALAQLDPAAAAAELGRDQDADLLAPLVDARRDGVALLDGARLATVDPAGALVAVEAHLGRLAPLLRQVSERLPDLDGALVDQLDRGQPAPGLERPWPLVITLLGRMASALSRAHAGGADLGLGLFLSRAAAEETGPRLLAAELSARAAACARIAEEHDEIPARLADTAAALLELLRPFGKETGSEELRRQRRRSRAEAALLVPRQHLVDGGIAAEVVADILERARSCANAEVRRRARALGASTRTAAAEVARATTGSLPALLREASETGRALLVAAIALDPEQGAALARASGREAAQKCVEGFGTRALTLTLQRYVERA